MRITGGLARGIPLKAPRGEATRPATDYLREALFSSLGPLDPATNTLDLFAGTGAYGLEALSRGILKVTFVEKHSGTLRYLQGNLAAVEKSLARRTNSPLTEILERDVFRWQPNRCFDLIFADPPYPLWESQGESLLTHIAPWLSRSENARLILEAPGNYIPPVPPGLRRIKRIGKGPHQPGLIILGVG